MLSQNICFFIHISVSSHNETKWEFCCYSLRNFLVVVVAVANFLLAAFARQFTFWIIWNNRHHVVHVTYRYTCINICVAPLCHCTLNRHPAPSISICSISAACTLYGNRNSFWYPVNFVRFKLKFNTVLLRTFIRVSMFVSSLLLCMGAWMENRGIVNS